MEQNGRRFTVLTDADSVFPEYIEYILGEVSDVGITTYKRIYGGWTDNEKCSRENMLLDWSVSPIRQYSYTTGKSATDSATVIDTTDTLCPGNIGGFCLVSSGSDFTKLAQHLREAGIFVMGTRKQKTPKPSRVACDTFKLPEIMSSDDVPGTSVIENQRTTTNIDEIQEATTKLLIKDNGQNQFIILVKVDDFFTKRFSDPDARNYGYPKPSTFSKSLNNNDFQVVKLHGSYFVQEKSASIPKAGIEKEIIRIIKGYNGHVDNLSIIRDELRKTYPSFDAKRHGSSRISSFIRSFGTFRIKDNMIQLR